MTPCPPPPKQEMAPKRATRWMGRLHFSLSSEKKTKKWGRRVGKLTRVPPLQLQPGRQDLITDLMRIPGDQVLDLDQGHPRVALDLDPPML
ncbi:hypothetical protein NL676_023288 [Syzygium grande]|nr:hypothetical protein NL676_023288 [Syzygium grande]